MATSNIVSALGAGSGIDIQTLAKDLMEAERTPRKQQIENRISQTQARISGYSAVKFAIRELKAAFEKLNDASDFSSLKISHSQPSSFGLTASPTATAGSYGIHVLEIARAQRTTSLNFPERSMTLNGGAPFSLQLQVGNGGVRNIDVTTTTPGGIVSAINGAKLGVTAQIINTGSGHQIVLTGATGAAQAFGLSGGPSMSAKAEVVGTSTDPLKVSADAEATAVTLQYADPSDPQQTVSFSLIRQSDGSWTLPDDAAPIPEGAALSVTAVRPIFGARPLQTAQDADLDVNGIRITRPTNVINDLIDGVTLNVFTPTAQASQVELSRDTTAIKESVQALIAAHKDFEETLKILGDRDSQVEQFGGALAGDSLLGSLRNQVRTMVTALSTTPGERVKAARHIGLEFDKFGLLNLDEEKFETALQTRFDEVMVMFSAGTNKQALTSPAPAGLAGEAIKRLDAMLKFGNVIDQQSQRASESVKRQESDLLKLEERMEQLLARYMKQFSAMESIVGNSNSLRTSLKSSFEGMRNMYKS
jgi:flagellar hook-associated protein 2